MKKFRKMITTLALSASLLLTGCSTTVLAAAAAIYASIAAEPKSVNIAAVKA